MPPVIAWTRQVLKLFEYRVCRRRRGFAGGFTFLSPGHAGGIVVGRWVLDLLNPSGHGINTE